MAITPLSTPLPNTSNMTEAQFNAAMNTFFSELATFGAQINEAIEAMNLNAVTGTSASSIAIGTGSKSLTASTGKSWVGGMFIAIADTAAPSTNVMYGIVTSYNSSTGALVVNVTYTVGSGTKASWTISQSSPTNISGSMVLLSSVTASASATVDLETTFNSTYDEYMILGTAIVPASPGQNLNCRMKLGGSYQTTGYRYHNTMPSDGSNLYGASASASAAIISIGEGVGANLDFTMHVRNVTNAIIRKLLHFHGAYMLNSGPSLSLISGAGTNDNTGALTGIRFMMSSGNIASGTFRLYGIRKQ
ncbi:hypothetical protein [Nitrosomonas sp. Nm34]|uniref:hypothetical protein n=1 Tax=Nitrosomonas sp. Nm34 TaxID=1881055 RepID=UPI0008F2DD99|nr:hypothetical protein [Nitrosomonas sp. Nm34]SFI94606.1 hypothetical protein SAMN05428978_10643 [Nitrosomonas sp. Nm34]